MALGRPAESTAAPAASPAREHRSSGVESPHDKIPLSLLRAAFHLVVLAALAGTVFSLAKPAGPATPSTPSAQEHDPDSTDKPLP